MSAHEEMGGTPCPACCVTLDVHEYFRPDCPGEEQEDEQMPNEKPSGLKEMAYDLMVSCWDAVLEDRPSREMQDGILRALREAEARGAREMRERAARAAELANNTVIFKMGGSLVEDTKEHVASAIRSLPLPGEEE